MALLYFEKKEPIPCNYTIYPFALFPLKRCRKMQSFLRVKNATGFVFWSVPKSVFVGGGFSLLNTTNLISNLLRDLFGFFCSIEKGILKLRLYPVPSRSLIFALHPPLDRPCWDSNLWALSSWFYFGIMIYAVHFTYLHSSIPEYIVNCQASQSCKNYIWWRVYCSFYLISSVRIAAVLGVYLLSAFNFKVT